MLFFFSFGAVTLSVTNLICKTKTTNIFALAQVSLWGGCGMRRAGARGRVLGISEKVGVLGPQWQHSLKQAWKQPVETCHTEAAS